MLRESVNGARMTSKNNEPLKMTEYFNWYLGSYYILAKTAGSTAGHTDISADGTYWSANCRTHPSSDGRTMGGFCGRWQKGPPIVRL